jgi:C-terminal processing protease CtpA/Prc
MFAKIEQHKAAIFVSALKDNSPLAGVGKGDAIVNINGRDVRGRDCDEVKSILAEESAACVEGQVSRLQAHSLIQIPDRYTYDMQILTDC